MKKVSDLKPGDVIVENGVRFTIDNIAETPDGHVLILFKYMPATSENVEAYGSLLRKAKEGRNLHFKEGEH